MKWEYKTILVPAVTDWLHNNEMELFYSASTGLVDSTQYERRKLAAQIGATAIACSGGIADPDYGMKSDPAVKKKACDEIFSKHSTFLNEQLGILGQEGWELVSIWNSEPVPLLFEYAAQWMTFKRSV